MRGRIRFQAVLLIVFFLYLAVRLYWVQIHSHDDYYKEARKKYVASKTIKGIRGEIFDRNGNLLIANMPCQDVTITPCNIARENDRKLARLIAGTLELNFDTVLGKISNKTRLVTQPDGSKVEAPRQYDMIARNVPLEKSRKLQELLKKHKLSRDVHFHDGFIRYNPKGKLLSNVLGLTTMANDNIQALGGVEKFYNKELSSDSGKKVYMRSRDGRQMGDALLAEESSRDGRNLYLTIDEAIQSIMEEELDAACEKWQPKAAYAIMADPVTGDILGMAQRPSFDPNNRSSQDQSVYRARVVEDVFEPGSIMKPLTVAGALDYGVVRPETMIDCENSIWFYRGSRLTDTHSYGMQNVTGVIRKSSNIGTAKIAIMMGEQKLYRTFCKFGLGTRSGLPLKPESLGLFKPVHKWDGLSISRFGMGYGIAITPAQMLRAYCALANRGKLPKLRLLDRDEDPHTGEIRMLPRAPVQTIYSEQTGEEIVNMMVTVTETGGTATKAAIPGYRVAGKTGTAHKNVGGHYLNKYFASFVGFAPAEKPAFLLLLTFDEPKGAKYGGTVAAPFWRRIAERTLKYMNIAPSQAVEKP